MFSRATTVSEDERLIDQAHPTVNELRANQVTVDAEFGAMIFKAKIAHTEPQRVHIMLFSSGKDWEAGNHSVRLHHGDPQGAEPEAAVIADYSGSLQALNPDHGNSLKNLLSE